MEPEDPALARARQNHGFARVELLEGNVGYVDMRYFDGNPAAKPVGVTPHVEVSADGAFDIALEMAQAAAEAFRAEDGHPRFVEVTAQP